MKKLLCVILMAMVPAFAQYEAIDFTQLIKEVPTIDKSLWEMHFALYQGYVSNTNLVEDMLKKTPINQLKGLYVYQALQRRFSWEYNGMVLHELFFANLGKHPLQRNSSLAQAILSKFQSFKNFEQQFKDLCKMRGIGWGVLYWNYEADSLHLDWIEEHNIGALITAEPLLVIDIWEHAYITQFGIDRSMYLDTIFDAINWEIVEKRFSLIAR